MSTYRYVALDATHRRTAGTVVASDRDSALRALSERFENIVSLRADRPRRGGKAPTQRDLLQFTLQMDSLLRAGLTVKSSLDIAMEDARDTNLYPILADINSNVTSGVPLSVCCRQHPEAFSPFYCNLLEAGEAAGKLPDVLGRVGEYLERAAEIRGQVRAALAYPTVVLLFAVVITGGVLALVVPRFEGIYRDLGQRLPWFTEVILAASRLLANFWPIVLMLGLLAYWLLRRFARSDAGGLLIDRLKLGSHPLGNIYRDLIMARFSRALGLMYGSGVPITAALQLTSGALGNRVAERIVRNAAAGLRSGQSLASQLRHTSLFPKMAVGMVAAGEESGALEEMLERLASYFDTSTQLSIKAWSASIEPALMMVVGLLVGGLVLALGLPFMNLVSAL